MKDDLLKSVLNSFNICVFFTGKNMRVSEWCSAKMPGTINRRQTSFETRNSKPRNERGTYLSAKTRGIESRLEDVIRYNKKGNIYFNLLLHPSDLVEVFPRLRVLRGSDSY